MSHPAKLALADGTVYAGQGFGARGEVYGELVFNTSLTGYQEILSDPSYAGQIVTMTYPLIGNYGVNSEDVESSGLSLSGFVIRELCRRPSNQRCQQSLEAYLSEANVIGLQGIDTRSLVRRIRTRGAVTGVLSTEDLDDESVLAHWREGHWAFYARTLPLIGRAPSQDMPVLCERFEVIYHEENQGQSDC